MTEKTVTIEVALGSRLTSQPMLFETKTADADGGKFYVASAGNYRLSHRELQTQTKQGLLIGFGTDDVKDPKSGAYTDYFAFGADDDKKVIAQQLREMADWFEQNA